MFKEQWCWIYFDSVPLYKSLRLIYIDIRELLTFFIDLFFQFELLFSDVFWACMIELVVSLQGDTVK
jgi:hypothetical protein